MGCGAGEMTIRLAAAGDQVTGGDPDSRMLAITAGRLAALPELRDRVELVEAGIDSLSLSLSLSPPPVTFFVAPQWGYRPSGPA
ncbi:methyltransferase domain-containing protein [Streptomyces sp. NPDC097704]|uniref:methyltransferase domain-containing protein n=1 Tax=Streptomyces sp. NPDC097704 TaxID=3157101 RepID=UPI0033285008